MITRVYDWLDSMGKPSSLMVGNDINPLLIHAPTYVLEELTETVEAIGGDAVEVYIKAMESTLAKLKSITPNKEPDMDAIRDGIADLYVTVSNIPYAAGIPSYIAGDDFEDVMDSNDTKLCHSLEEAEATVKAYAEGLHPDKMGVKIEVKHTSYSWGKYVIERVSDGKILKSINYQPPRLSSI